MLPYFHDRREAGRELAEKLAGYAGQNVLVLALPRGGVPVAYEVAEALNAPLDVYMVRKLGVPGYEELAMGAIATGGAVVLNPEVIEALRVTPSQVEAAQERERQELARCERKYRDGRPPPNISGRTVILIDDGLATGSTMRAAAAALKQDSPAKVLVAVPVGAAEACEQLRGLADEVVCAHTPDPFYAVGLWYLDFRPTGEQEVCDLLSKAAMRVEAAQ